MLIEQSPKLPFPHTEPRSQRIHSGLPAIQSTLRNQCQRSGNGIRCTVPRRKIGSRLRATA